MREYEYVTRALESLDGKAGLVLGGALALLTLSVSVEGSPAIRIVVGVAAILAGILGATTLAPSEVRVLDVRRLADKYGASPSRTLVLLSIVHYLDATESIRIRLRVNALRIRIALVLLFLSAVFCGLR